MKQYTRLIKILNKITNEVFPSDLTEVIKTPYLSKAFVLFFLHARFWISLEKWLEKYLTDGIDDGGIDWYYIDEISKIIYIIQAKYREEQNFEKKNIKMEELLKMDIDRIIWWNHTNEDWIKYNGKILWFIRELKRLTESDDWIADYTYEVVILANCDINKTNLIKLIGDYKISIYDSSKVYTELLYPYLLSRHRKANTVKIEICLSEKSAENHIDYSFLANGIECRYMILFVSLKEIWRIFHEYKNSILNYNPRSYQGFEWQKTNALIRTTALDSKDNEFALYNNWITIIATRANINNKVWVKDFAQVKIENPEIINWWQTSYTLAKIYEKLNEDEKDKILSNKEVLVKIIVPDINTNPDAWKRLIENISSATNTQTPVSNADRLSNHVNQIHLQEILFRKYWIIYERKKGEFYEAISNWILERKEVLDRNIFYKLLFCSRWEIKMAIRGKLFNSNYWEIVDFDELDNFYLCFLIYTKLTIWVNKMKLLQQEDVYSKVYLIYKLILIWLIDKVLIESLEKHDLEMYWNDFFSVASKVSNQTKTDWTAVFNKSRWIKKDIFIKNVSDYCLSKIIKSSTSASPHDSLYYWDRDI